MSKLMSILLALVAVTMLLSEPETGVSYAYMIAWYITGFICVGVSHLLWKSEI